MSILTGIFSTITNLEIGIWLVLSRFQNGLFKNFVLTFQTQSNYPKVEFVIIKSSCIQLPKFEGQTHKTNFKTKQVITVYI